MAESLGASDRATRVDKKTMATTKTTRKKSPKTVSSSRKSDKRRGEIMRVAIETINAKSFAQATMIDIAAALDLRDATLYHYFHDKRTLAYACCRASLERAQKLLEASDHTGGTGAQKLRHFVRTLLADSSENGALLYLGDISYLDSMQRRTIRQWIDRLRAILVQFLSEGMKDGSIVECEPELVVQLFLGMLIWLGKWVPSIPDLTIDRLMTAIEAFSFQGMAHEEPGQPQQLAAPTPVSGEKA